MSEPQRHPYSHPLNAPGDFYVVNEFCIACEAPEAEAPDLMAHDSDGARYHCYFKRQPATREETERACSAVEVGCCGAVRYGGRDPAVLKRLKKWGRDASDYGDSK